MEDNITAIIMERCASCNALDCEKPVFGYIDGEFLCKDCFFVKDNNSSFSGYSSTEPYEITHIHDLIEQSEQEEVMVQYPAFTVLENNYCQMHSEQMSYEDEEFSALDAQYQEAERRSLEYSMLEAQYEESQRSQPQYSLLDLSDIPTINDRPMMEQPTVHFYDPQNCCIQDFNTETYYQHPFNPQVYHCQNFTNNLSTDEYVTASVSQEDIGAENLPPTEDINSVDQEVDPKQLEADFLNLQSLCLAEEEVYPMFIEKQVFPSPCYDVENRQTYTRIALNDPRDMNQDVLQKNKLSNVPNINIPQFSASKKMIVEQHTIALHNLIPLKSQSIDGKNSRPVTPTTDNDVETCSNRAVACDESAEETANTRRPLICPVSDCGRMVALTSMVAHFKCEHPRVAFLIVRFGGTKHLAVDTNILPYDETRCVALILVDPNAIRRPTNKSNVETDSVSTSAGMSTFGSAGTSSTYPTMFVPGQNQAYSYLKPPSNAATVTQSDAAPTNFSNPFTPSDCKPVTNDNFEKYKDFIPLPLMVAKIRAEFSEDEEEDTKGKPKRKKAPNPGKYRCPKTKGQLNLAQPTQLEHEMDELDKLDIFATASPKPEDEALPMEITVNDVIVLWIAGITTDIPYSYTITAFNTQQTRHMSFRGPIHNLRERQNGYHLCSTTDSMIIYHAMLKRLTNNATQSVELQVTIHDKNQ